MLSVNDAWNPWEEQLLARVVDLVWATSGEARHGDKGSPSSEQMMEAFFFMDFCISCMHFCWQLGLQQRAEYGDYHHGLTWSYAQDKSLTISSREFERSRTKHKWAPKASLQKITAAKRRSYINFNFNRAQLGDGLRQLGDIPVLRLSWCCPG